MSETSGLPKVTVILALHRPSAALALRQIDSLIGQTGVDLTCVAVLDGNETAADPELLEALTRPRFEIVINQQTLGVRLAFAAGLRRGLELTGKSQGFFAYCDQDDVWHSDKLSRCCGLARTSGASLVHCDARVMAENGKLIAQSLHRYESRSEADDLLQCLLLNSVTGMTTLFTAEAARLATVLCENYDGELLHDHITAAAAASLGPIAFLDTPLVDYVQHDDNQLGAKMHRPAWRRRALGLTHIAAYRQTSAEIFGERRKLALLLAREGLLPPPLATLFKTGRSQTPAVLFLRYYLTILSLLLKGQFRRATLCARMMDAALWYR